MCGRRDSTGVRVAAFGRSGVQGVSPVGSPGQSPGVLAMLVWENFCVRGNDQDFRAVKAHWDSILESILLELSLIEWFEREVASECPFA